MERPRRPTRLALLAACLATCLLAPSPPAPAQSVPPLPAGNQGVETFATLFQDGWIGTTRSEAEAGQDLSGDGDQLDTVPWLRNTRTGEEHTIPVAGVPTILPGPGRRWAVVFLFELEHHVDLNGDGDLDDQVRAIYHLDTRTLDILAAAGPLMPPQLFGERYVGFQFSEFAWNTDLNGDGDNFDPFFQLYDVHARTSWSPALSSITIPSSWDGRHLAYAVGESWAANTDVNGDGDALDLVLFVLDTRLGTITNTGRSILLPQPRPIAAGTMLLDVAESELGLDVDGDGLLESVVLCLFRPDSGTFRPTSLAFRGSSGPKQVVADGRWFLLDLREGTGSLDHRFLWRIDSTTGSVLDLGLDLGGSERFGSSERVAIESTGGLGATLVREGAIDLNGDGDTLDYVLHRIELASGTVTNLGLSARHDSLTAGPGGRLGFAVRESSQGAMDLNGDGDTRDGVVAVLEPDGSLTILPLATASSPLGGIPWMDLDDRFVAVDVLEWLQGTTDMNADGDADDRALMVWDSVTRNLLRVGVARFDYKLEDGTLLFRVSESQDARGTDLNGDGDLDDWVLHLLEL